MTYFLGNGDGTFQPETQFGGIPSPMHVDTADFNGDGKLDLAIASAGNIGGDAVLLNMSQPPAAQPFNNAEAAGGSTSIAQSSLVSAYANGSTVLGTTTGTVAPTPAWPANLAGTTVSVLDSAGKTWPAQIYFVDANQVNYAMPAGVATGAATVTITAGNGAVSAAPANMVAVSPGLFAVGPNLAAVNVIRVTGSTQTVENDYEVNSSGNIVARPIPLNPATDRVYLVLYASGVRQAKSVTSTVGGQAVPVFFAGAQQTYPGLDQVNIGPLPATLAAAGSVTIQVIADGIAANPVQITVQ